MNQGTIQILFSLLRSAINGERLSEQEKSLFSAEQINDLYKISEKHDVQHLLVYALKQNGLLPDVNKNLEKTIIKAVYRYERQNYEYERLCLALESANIPFIPLKGSIIRKYYLEPWMRTSCDIDVLIHLEDLEKAIRYLTEKMEYVEKERATHDVSLYSPSGIHIELHFDLVEEGRANKAIDVLRTVWQDAKLREQSQFCYEMSDEFFYFYHIAHMAKHFESGGCGIRPFIDLWILDRLNNADKIKRDKLLEKADLLKFADVSRALSKVWFGGETADERSILMQDFLLRGGVYGSADNRVAIQQKKKGGRIGYIFSRIFIPYEKLKRYYPVLEKHRYLTPFMQVRRWFMLLKPDVAKMAKQELKSNKNLDKDKADKMKNFLDEIGL